MVALGNRLGDMSLRAIACRAVDCGIRYRDRVRLCGALAHDDKRFSAVEGKTE